LPWIGLSLAIGATLGQVLHIAPKWRRIAGAAILVVLAANLIYQRAQAQPVLESIAAITQDVESIREQMLAIVPDPSDKTHFFAYELPPTTDYVQAMASVWYDQPFTGLGGYIGRLKDHGQASNEYYLLNFEDDILYNLMPELQNAAHTFFIWKENPVAEIVHPDGTPTTLDEGSYQLNTLTGPPEARRLGIFLHPPAPADGWASLAYLVTVPENSSLRFATRRETGGLAVEDGMLFRVIVTRPSRESEIIYSDFVEPQKNNIFEPWTEVSIPMNKYWGVDVEIRLEVAAGENLIHDHGYWANPRFVIEETS
jgi:hypothetical protein